MKRIQIVLLAILGIVLLVTGFIAWFCTGSFVYQSSMTKNFVIDAPVSVVCKRALNVKSLPKSEDGAQTNVDVQEAVKNVTLGEPIEIEIEHPKLGKIKAKIKIFFEITPTSLQIQGNTVEIEPSHFEKFGKSLADVNKFSFKLGIIAKDAESGGLFQFLPTTGSTEIEVQSASELKIYFREMGLVRSQIDQAIAKSQKKILTQIETFINDILRKPTEEELAEQKKPEKKNNWFMKIKEMNQEVPQQPTEETENLDEEGIDFSALDEEL